MNNKNKVILVLATLSLFIFSATISALPYSEEITQERFFISQEQTINCTSMGIGWGGDFENATVYWNTTTVNQTLFFAVIGYNNTLPFQSNESCGSVFINRTYFLEYPFQTNMGGTDWRGVHVYLWSEIGEAFNLTLTIDGFVYRHYIDYTLQESIRFGSVIIAYLIWVVVVFYVTRPESAVETLI